MESSFTSWLNGIAQHPGVRQPAVGGAKYLMVVPALIVVYLAVRSVIRRDTDAIASMLVAGIGTGLALLANMAANSIWFRARPYNTLADVQTLITRATESSFFSDHTIVVTGCAFAAVLVSRRWGIAAIGAAFLVGLSRIAVGAHYPSDVLTGAVVTAALIAVLLPVRSTVATFVTWVLGQIGLTPRPAAAEGQVGPPPA